MHAAREAWRRVATALPGSRAFLASNDRAILAVASIPIVLVAMAPMLRLRAVFAQDWINHLWMIEYFGEFLKQSATLPRVLNTVQVAGMPITLLYGRMFYAVAGALSAALGSVLAIRILVWAVLTLQFLHVSGAALRLGANRTQALVLAIIVSWSIYPLTNLYNRAALTEFFAVALLTGALSSLLAAALADEGRPVRYYDWIAAGFFYAAAAGTHPLTAVFGGMFLAILGIFLFLSGGGPGRKVLLVGGLMNAVLAAVVLCPWLYLVYRFRQHLPVSGNSDFNAMLFRRLGFFPQSIDLFWSRLYPMPLDLRSVRHGLDQVMTPYLDAQAAVPLILFALVMLTGFRSMLRPVEHRAARLAVVGASLGLAGLSLAVSVRPSLSAWFGGMFDVLQYPYRLTSYINLGVLAAVLALGAIVWRPGNCRDRYWSSHVIAACAALSFAALMVKLIHASAIRDVTLHASSIVPSARPLVTPFGNEDPSTAWKPLRFAPALHVDRLPTSFYATFAYTVIDGFGSAPPAGTTPVIYRTFDIRNGPAFGSTSPMQISVAEPTLVTTNVQPFPWNRLSIDGTEVPRSAANVVSLPLGDGNPFYVLSVLVPAGSHRLDLTCVEDRIWVWLDRISWVVFLLWLLTCCTAATVRTCRLGRK
jgi:hypothetical protein